MTIAQHEHCETANTTSSHSGDLAGEGSDAPWVLGPGERELGEIDNHMALLPPPRRQTASGETGWWLATGRLEGGRVCEILNIVGLAMMLSLMDCNRAVVRGVLDVSLLARQVFYDFDSSVVSLAGLTGSIYTTAGPFRFTRFVCFILHSPVSALTLITLLRKLHSQEENHRQYEDHCSHSPCLRNCSVRPLNAGALCWFQAWLYGRL